MKTMTVLENRLKKAHEYRQSAFTRNKIYPVTPGGNQVSEQYAPARSEELIPAGKTAPVEWMERIKVSLQQIRWKPFGIGQVLFILALSAILLIILYSG